MSNELLVQQAAERLRNADTSGVPCAPIRELIGESDLASAYAVQAINHQLRLNEGARVTGYKIGLTNPIIQKQLGVAQPDYGALYHDREVDLGGSLSISAVMQGRVEAEVAIVLGKDLPMHPIGASELMRATEFALASIEIVGSRILDWNIRITDTIADNASASHYVLGHHPQKLGTFDLINGKMEMYKNGELASQGKGSDCLESPVNAAVWLANTMISQGQKLQAGTILLTGALGPMVSVAAGDHIETRIEGLGSVSVSFTA